MKRKAVWLVVLLLGVSCVPYVTAVQYATSTYPTSRVFDKPYDVVWNAVMNVLQAYPIRTIEKDSGIIVTDSIHFESMPEYKIGYYPEGKQPENSVVLGPGIVVRTPGINPKGFARCNVRVEKLDDTHTRVSINVISTLYYPATQIDPMGIPQPIQKEFETASRGYFEAVLLWKIAKELGINEPEPPLPQF